jgi:sterol desaturase/sphingolipid hydroxylase (fatty acid hydroxylase superfamily)
MERRVSNFILAYESVIRLSFFLGILVLMAAWEKLSPRRPMTTSKALRWYSNLSMVIIDTLALRLLLPIQAVGMALFVQNRGWGLLNYVSLPHWLAIVIGILGLDLVIYLQHAMFHSIPLFWRLHRIHHTDLDFDVTTGIRFHPVEILLSMGIKMVAVTILGPSPVAIILFEVILNATSMFNHGNVRLPGSIDRMLRL